MFLINMLLVRQKCWEGTIYKEHSKAFMTRIRKQIFKKSDRRNPKALYVTLKALCITLEKTKREFYGNINEKDVKDNKSFWKTVKPFFSEKAMTQNKLTLIDKNPLKQYSSRSFEYFFTEIVVNLKTPEFKGLSAHLDDKEDPILNNWEIQKSSQYNCY